ncbi:MAG TPA: hypothetical protein VNJ08_00330 [Bacteriovoracaceae bacterium]|nr:hypothetical protein [Bacteriovoracaceae bacterium]
MKNKQSGQALVELIIFLPLMFALYGMISGFASAIYGSINQQKITRGYFYFRINGNSMVPKAAMDVANDWKKFGMFYIGWMQSMQGDEPIATCYQVTIPNSPPSGDTCEVAYDKDTTQFIRVGTVYGLCGATFAKDPSSPTFFIMPDADGASFREAIDLNSCLIQ